MGCIKLKWGSRTVCHGESFVFVFFSFGVMLEPCFWLTVLLFVPSFPLYSIPGRYASIQGMSSCIDCMIDSFAEGINSTSCKNCTFGRHAPDGSTQCSDCPNGKSKSSDSNKDFICTNCIAGFWAAAGDYICQKCESGQYQDDTTQSKCKACPKGLYNEEEGAKAISFCKAVPKENTLLPKE